MTAPFVTRSLSISYGTLTIGGTSAVHLDGVYDLVIGPDRLYVRCLGSITEETAANFETEVSTVESAVRQRRGDIAIVIGSTTFNFREAQNESFDNECTARKTAGGGNYRQYEFVITAGLPEATTGENGLRELSLTVSQDASERRLLTVVGVYTAQSGGNDARAQFAAQIASLKTTIINDVDNSVQWDEISREPVRDTKDHICGFRVLLIERRNDGLLGNNSIINPTLRISAITQAPGDSTADTNRDLEVTASYTASVPFGQTTDLKGLWANTILPDLKSQIKSQTGASQLHLIRSDPGIDPEGQTYAATVVALLRLPGSNVIESRRSIEESDDADTRWFGVWDDNSLAKTEIPKARNIIRVVTQEYIVRGRIADVVRKLNSTDPGNPRTTFAPPAPLTPNVGGGRWGFVGRTQRRTQEFYVGRRPDGYWRAQGAEAVVLIYYTEPVSGALASKEA